MRATLAGLLLVHAIGQLTAFWRASQIVSPGAVPNPAMLVNAAVPVVIVVGAIMLAVGLKTRFAALALMLLLAVASVMDLLLFGAVGSALDWLPRFSIMGGLAVVFVTGAGMLSVDGFMESRFAASLRSNVPALSNKHR
jgi:putative oxidoreductase